MEDCFGRIARECGVEIVGASNPRAVTAREWAGANGSGSSLVIGPDGEPVTQASHGEHDDTALTVEAVPK